jgi:hypothetical protein
MSAIPDGKWAFTSRHQRILEYKQCLASNSGSPCAGKIARAHIIPRSQLRKIARDGHIYAVPTKLISVMQMQHGSFAAEALGVGEFSTLNCFCTKHDKLLFAPLEDVPLTFSRKQLALLHYRALSAEYYQRRNQEEAANLELLLTDEDAPQADKFQWLSYINGKASEEAYEVFSRVESALRKRRYREMCGLIIRFKARPTVMSVGAFRPNYNVLGKRVQDLFLDCQYIAMHLLAFEGRAVLMLTWLQGDSAAEAFAKCFAAQPKEQITSLAIQAAFEHAEHTCMAREWWLGLKRVQQNLLLERVRRELTLI